MKSFSFILIGLIEKIAKLIVNFFETITDWKTNNIYLKFKRNFEKKLLKTVFIY